MKKLPVIASTALLACLWSGASTAALLEPEEVVVQALAFLTGDADDPSVIYSPDGAWPSLVRGFETPALGAEPGSAALAFVAGYAPLFGLHDPALETQVVSILAWRGRHIVRIEQVFDGLPVFGRQAVVRVTAGGRITAYASNLRPVDPGLSTMPALSAEAAGAEAACHVSWPSRTAGAELGVWISHDGAHLAWRVTLRGAEPHIAAIVVLDAVSGRVLAAGSPILQARGRVFLENPVRDSDTTTEVDILRLTGDGTKLTGENVVAWQYVPGGTPLQTAVADGSGDFLYDPVARGEAPDFDDEFAQVNAYYQMDSISHYFQTVHGYSQTRGPIAVFVNYVEDADTPYDNAFFDDTTWAISLGQASNGDFAYDADTMYHEYAHSVVDTLAHLVYMAADPMGMIVFPGALHEGLADTFAVSLTDDPDMSEYIFGRNLINSRRCPDDILGEMHYDGEIIGGTNWEIREQIGGPALETVAYSALASLHPTSSFREYSEGVMEAVDDMVTDGDLTAEQASAVEDILADRGVDVCDRIMRLEDASYTVTLFGLESFGSCSMLDMLRASDICFPPTFQWGIDVPADATTLTFSPVLSIPGGPDYDVAVHVRGGNYVVYEMVTLPYGGGITMPLRVEEADGTFTDPDGPIVLTPYTDPPLTPGEPYFFSVNYRGCRTGTLTVSATLGFDPVDDPEAEDEPEPVAEEEPEVEDDASGDPTPDPGSVRARGGTCGCSLVH